LTALTKPQKMAYSARIEKALRNKVKDHNEEVEELDLAWDAKVTYKTILEVFKRGIGAYKTNPSSVRPGVQSADQWAFARCNSFLYALKEGMFKRGKHDTDLLPKEHPVRKEMDERDLKDIDRKPTAGMMKEAEKGLEWRREYNRGGTAIGVARARDIASGKNLSLSSIKRMYSFFSRHEVDKQAEGFNYGEEGYPSAGRIAWALWGGDAGFKWSTKKVQEIKKEEKNLEMEAKEIKNIEKETREIVGTIITDGLELPLFDSIAEAEAEAEKLGGTGYHEHTIDGEVFYMPFEDHEQAKKVMGKINMKEHYPGHEKEEEEEVLVEDNSKDEDYRNKLSPDIETRNFKLEDVEVREHEDGHLVVGYGAVFNSESNNLGGFTEFISRDAFEGREKDDVRFLLNHDPNYIMGRTTSGTLKLRVDEKGLRYEVAIPDTSAGRDLLISLKRGDITQSSFAFTVEKDSWSQSETGAAVRTIEKVSRLFDVSAVTYPAYPNASVGLRSMETWKNNLKESLEHEKRENEKQEIDQWNRSLAVRKLKIVKLK